MTIEHFTKHMTIQQAVQVLKDVKLSHSWYNGLPVTMPAWFNQLDAESRIYSIGLITNTAVKILKTALNNRRTEYVSL